MGNEGNLEFKNIHIGSPSPGNPPEYVPPARNQEGLFGGELNALALLDMPHQFCHFLHILKRPNMYWPIFAARNQIFGVGSKRTLDDRVLVLEVRESVGLVPFVGVEYHNKVVGSGA